MESKQTAVEWLIEQIKEQRESGETDLRTTLYYCKEAEEMEKEQIMEAYNNGEDRSAELYYNETYGK